jgi:uncharacterized membrane protein
MREATDGPETSTAPSTDERRVRRISSAGAFGAVKAHHAAQRTRFESVADQLTILAGSTPFLVSHVVWFATWVAWNTGLLGLPAFDPYPFGFLTLVVSLEAIFLSIFVLMTQARESTIGELREEVALQVSLRTEAEVTKALQLISGLYTRLGQKLVEDDELREMLQPLDPTDIERDLAEQIRAVNGGRPKR